MTGMMTSKYNTKNNEPLVEGEERVTISRTTWAT